MVHNAPDENAGKYPCFFCLHSYNPCCLAIESKQIKDLKCKAQTHNQFIFSNCCLLFSKASYTVILPDGTEKKGLN